MHFLCGDAGTAAYASPADAFLYDSAVSCKEVITNMQTPLPAYSKTLAWIKMSMTTLTNAEVETMHGSDSRIIDRLVCR